jgi:hypothetical protein
MIHLQLLLMASSRSSGNSLRQILPRWPFFVFATDTVFYVFSGFEFTEFPIIALFDRASIVSE